MKLFLLFLSIISYDNLLSQYTISGIVYNCFGESSKETSLFIEQIGGNKRERYFTDSSGKFQFFNLDSGCYLLRISSYDFNSVRFLKVDRNINGLEILLHLRLKPAQVTRVRRDETTKKLIFYSEAEYDDCLK